MAASPRTERFDQLSRVCGACALAFLLAIVALFILERIGIGREIVRYLVVAIPLACYGAVGLMSWTQDPSEFQGAGRQIPAVFAGMAGAAEWSAAAVILGSSASLFLTGSDGRALLIGLTGGYLLLAMLIAPFVRNSGAHTASDFLGIRYGGFVRFLVIVVLLVCSLLFLSGLMQAAVGVAVRMFASEIALGIFVVVILLCVVAGGMSGVAATQTVQYVMLLIACSALFVIFEAGRFDVPVGAIHEPLVQALELLARSAGLVPAPSPRSVPFRMADTISSLELILCLMAGTASLPHVLSRALATRSMGAARAAIAWSLLFIAGLVFMLPTYMMLAHFRVMGDHSSLVAGLVDTVGLTAMLAAGSSLLLVMALSVYRADSVSPPPTAVVRVLLVVLAAPAAALAAHHPFDPATMLAWAFSLAAAGYFPALVLGIWWTRTTRAAAFCGMVAGFGLSLFYIAVTRYFPHAGVVHFGMAPLTDPANGLPLVNAARVLANPQWMADVPASADNPLASKIDWFNVSNLASGLFGLSIGFLTIIVVTLLGAKPSPQQRTLVETLRAPGGARPS